MNHSLGRSYYGVHIDPYCGFKITLDHDLQPISCGVSLGPLGDSQHQPEPSNLTFNKGGI